MDNSLLQQLFKHNNWANNCIIDFCANLSDAQIDAQRRSVTSGSIRYTLVHLVSAQQGYLNLLTVPVEARVTSSVAYAELKSAAELSGRGLLLLSAQIEGFKRGMIETTDGYFVEPWVVLLQAILHAAEHREQISSMLTDLGIDPPGLDGWSFGASEGSLVPITAG